MFRPILVGISEFRVFCFSWKFTHSCVIGVVEFTVFLSSLCFMARELFPVLRPLFAFAQA